MLPSKLREPPTAPHPPPVGLSPDSEQKVLGHWAEIPGSAQGPDLSVMDSTAPLFREGPTRGSPSTLQDLVRPSEEASNSSRTLFLKERDLRSLVGHEIPRVSELNIQFSTGIERLPASTSNSSPDA